MRKMLIHGIAVGLLTAILVLSTVAIHSGSVHHIAEYLSGSGNSSFLWGTNMLLIASAFLMRRKSIVWLALKIDTTVLLVVHISKLIGENVMLGEWALRPNGSSGGFPSGHATHAFAMAFLMSYFSPRCWLLWYSLAAGIAWSRIEMSAHTPLQVTAGICFGLAISYGFLHNWFAYSKASKPCAPLPAKIVA